MVSINLGVLILRVILGILRRAGRHRSREGQPENLEVRESTCNISFADENYGATYCVADLAKSSDNLDRLNGSPQELARAKILRSSGCKAEEERKWLQQQAS